jgi:hypothetical protein
MIKVDPIKAYQYRAEDDSLVGEMPLEDALSGYEWWQNHHIYDETEINYPQFDSFFSEGNVPNYLDAEFQAPYVVTIFQ